MQTLIDHPAASVITLFSLVALTFIAKRLGLIAWLAWLDRPTPSRRRSAQRKSAQRKSRQKRSQPRSPQRGQRGILEHTPVKYSAANAPDCAQEPRASSATGGLRSFLCSLQSRLLQSVPREQVRPPVGQV
jgi:hypothetical protein